MNAKILNRDFQHPADGWYQIEPKGDHPNRSAGVIQVIDDEAVNSIVNRFNADAAAPDFAGMLIDHEHFKHDTDKETRAYGWLMKLQNRADGVYGQIKWTNTGKAAVDGGDYRFFSTEYDPADLKILNSGAPKRIRPLRLDGLTLTNNPNNKGGKPITNRENDLAGATALADMQPQQQQRKTMKTVCTLLGLSAEADEPSVHAAITKLLNRAESAEGKIVPLNDEITKIKNRVAELESGNAELLGEQMDALLDAHGVKTDAPIRNILKPHLQGLKNRAERVAALIHLGHKPMETKASVGARVLNRQSGAPLPDENENEPDGKFRKIFNRHIAAGKKRSEAVQLAIEEDRDAHAEWLKNGGGKL